MINNYFWTAIHVHRANKAVEGFVNTLQEEGAALFCSLHIFFKSSITSTQYDTTVVKSMSLRYQHTLRVYKQKENFYCLNIYLHTYRYTHNAPNKHFTSQDLKQDVPVKLHRKGHLHT